MFNEFKVGDKIAMEGDFNRFEGIVVDLFEGDGLPIAVVRGRDVYGSRTCTVPVSFLMDRVNLKD